MTSLFSILYVVHNEEQQDLPESAIEREQARLFKDGDRGAFDWFFNRYREPVYRFCYKHLKNEEAALDAVQESFLRLLGMRERLKPGQGVKNYLFTIALNYCYDVLRKEQFRKTGSLTPLVEDKGL